MTEVQRADLGEVSPKLLERIEILEAVGWRFLGAIHPGLEDLGQGISRAHPGLFTAEACRHGRAPLRESSTTVRGLVEAAEWQEARLQDLAPKPSASVVHDVATSREVAPLIRGGQ